MKKAILFLGAIALLASCQNNETQPESVEIEKDVVVESKYALSDISLTWIAYKHSDKKPVKGIFENVQIDGFKSGETIEECLANTTFEIATSSVNSNNADRDSKIGKHFFGNLIDPNGLTGNMVSMENGKGQFQLKMNDFDHEVNFDYTFEADTFKMTGSFNTLDWDSHVAIDSMQAACELLHTGEDGVSQLWPDVSFEMSAVIKK